MTIKYVKKDSGSEIVHGNRKLWRYMSLEKFFNLLITEELHFPRLSLLTDKYEGGAQFPSEPTFVGTTPPIMRIKLPKGAWDGEYMLDAPMRSYVNCWSLRTHESFALWKIYLDGAKAGVAITTTVSTLRDAMQQARIEDKGHLLMDKVQYIKPNPKETYQDDELVFMKMPYYDSEEEWRIAITYNYLESEARNVPEFVRVRIPVFDIIKNVYISPFMKPALCRSMTQAIKKMSPRLGGKIIESRILDQ